MFKDTVFAIDLDLAGLDHIPHKDIEMFAGIIKGKVKDLKMSKSSHENILALEQFFAIDHNPQDNLGAVAEKQFQTFEDMFDQWKLTYLHNHTRRLE
jgi:hypothetical protein